MKNETIVQKAIMIANETNTIYIRNGAGRRMTEDVKEEFMSEVRPISARYLKLSTADENTFGFSDTGLIIGALCRFKGNPKHFEGGTSQRSAAPFREMTADSMIKRCTDVTEDFDYIRPGELLWTNGHVGLYIGNGQAVEATESWDDGVQITGVAGICDPDEPKQRRWKKHGKMPWVEYRYPAKQNYIEIADQVLRGEWGIKHEDIREHLKAAGYNDRLIFQEMEHKLAPFREKSMKQIAAGVMIGRWGETIQEQNRRLEIAGYNSHSIRSLISKIRSGKI